MSNSKRSYWLLKSEPSEYSFSRLAAEGRARWDGIRNFEARNYLRAMSVGDLALVWATEGRRLCAGVGLARRRAGVALGVALFLLVVLAYGVGAAVVDTSRQNLWAVTMVVSLMHFWYDGFIWSVARRQV